MVSTDQAAAVGAFLSGVASVITARFYVRRAKREAEEVCDRRIAEFERALHQGIDIARHEDHPTD